MPDALACSLADIKEAVRSFESCRYTPQEFTHTRHLIVAAWYLTIFSPEDALCRMRTQLQRFTAHHGVKGYHETITRFWMVLAYQHLQSCPSRSLVEQVNTLLDIYPAKDVLFAYYSRDRVLSDEARVNWLAPDLCDLGHSSLTAN